MEIVFNVLIFSLAICCIQLMFLLSMKSIEALAEATIAVNKARKALEVKGE
jgi:hypothetical protein